MSNMTPEKRKFFTKFTVFTNSLTNFYHKVTNVPSI